ncbi:MAG: hypothetical protein GX022_00150 [Clostridiaceae bacterium]|nr:hypothetical protein [Clostridiaceae bacterium]
MSQIRLVIADKDILYLEKLSGYLQKNKSCGFYLELFTDACKFIEWLCSCKNADLLVISSSLYNELTVKPKNKNILLLRDCAESLVPQGVDSVNKYSPADRIMKEILSLCAEYIPRDINDENKNGRINLILYADGSDVLNPLAQGLAYLNAVRGKKVFYLNLDEFSNTDSYFNSDNTMGLSEMLYYVKSQKESLSLKAEVCTSFDVHTGIYYMKGHNNPEDIKNISEEELKALIRAVQRSLPYDEIIVSRAFLVDQLTIPLLIMAERIYISALNYQSSKDRLKKIGDLINGIEKNKGYHLKDKLIFCISLASDVKLPAGFDISGFKTVYLPCPCFENLEFFPPSNEYLEAFEVNLNAFEV